jgi:hypothetical protein
MLALLGVLMTGVFLIGLAAASFVVPDKAGRFLLSFAGTPFAHFLEMALRLAIGAAFVIRSPFMRFPEAFNFFGWVLIVTTAGLVVLPWRWHRRFAQRVVPPAIRRLEPIGIASLALGALVLTSAISPGQ